jgi:CheY-like chemotaxis protein
MDSKHILIVDDEESILTVLKNSLKKLGPDYQVVTVKDGFAALNKLQQQSFDLVVTDFNMDKMDGLELMETIHYMQPKARIIMITAYGNEILESEAEHLQVYRYLTKPLEINVFRQVVQEALGDLTSHGSGILVLSDERYQLVNQLMEQLRTDVNARCLFLTDAEGRTIARTGDTEQLSVEEMASLLGGGIATLIEAGRFLDGDKDAINLAYREGKDEYLYAINIGQQLLLILIIDRGPYSSRLGSVWYYAQQTALTLRQVLDEAEYVNPRQVFSEAVDEAFDAEIDKLFTRGNTLRF